MTDDPPQPNIAKIRQLLLAAFTPEELRRFCQDRPDFRVITKRFGPGQGKQDQGRQAAGDEPAPALSPPGPIGSGGVTS